MSKIIDGLNDRRNDATITQTGRGLSYDSSQPMEATDEEVEHVRGGLRDDARDKLKKEVDDQVALPQRGSA